VNRVEPKRLQEKAKFAQAEIGALREEAVVAFLFLFVEKLMKQGQ